MLYCMLDQNDHKNKIKIWNPLKNKLNVMYNFEIHKKYIKKNLI